MGRVSLFISAVWESMRSRVGGGSKLCLQRCKGLQIQRKREPLLPRWCPWLKKESPSANAGDAWDSGLILGLGLFPWVGNGNLLQYCLENSMDRGAWWATVHGVVKSRTRQRTFTRTIAGIRNSEKKGEDEKGCFAWGAALLCRMWGNCEANEAEKKTGVRLQKILVTLVQESGNDDTADPLGCCFGKWPSTHPAKIVWTWRIGAWVLGQLRNPLFCFFTT